MDLRLAREKDLFRIAELWVQMMREHGAFETRVTLAPNAVHAYHSYLMLHVHGPKSVVLVAERENDAGEKEIAGFCCAYVCQNLPMFLPAEFGYVSDLYVVPEFQRRGLGSRIMHYIRQYFKGCGVDTIQLQVYHSNLKGAAFWEKQGFRNFFDRLWLDLSEEEPRP